MNTQTPPETPAPKAARRGRGRPRLQDPTRELRVRAPRALLARLEAALAAPAARRAALILSIEELVTRSEAQQAAA